MSVLSTHKDNIWRTIPHDEPSLGDVPSSTGVAGADDIEEPHLRWLSGSTPSISLREKACESVRLFKVFSP